MKNLEKIIGKKAYWGRHTFEATKDIIDGEDVVRIDVYRNVPRIFEASYFVQSPKHIIELSTDESCALKFYSGRLNGNGSEVVYADRKLKTGRVINEKTTISIPTIEKFLKCFKYDLNN